MNVGVIEHVQNWCSYTIILILAIVVEPQLTVIEQYQKPSNVCPNK